MPPKTTSNPPSSRATKFFRFDEMMLVHLPFRIEARNTCLSGVGQNVF
jgi:hypothetical protein